mmetsp:Transcript_21730/g.28098  ORF Transcript_21730/g.28098 Transcript_21730/m.28098 type:complete len:674 (+) Transcript_21730:79-2100(+)
MTIGAMKVVLVFVVLACNVQAFVPHHVKSVVVPGLSTKEHVQATVFQPTTSRVVPPRASVVMKGLMAATTAEAAAGMNPLMEYFFETLISNGVPALFSVIVIAFAAKSFSSGRKKMDMDLLETENPVAELYDDLYGDLDQGVRSARGAFSFRQDKKKLPKNSGIPKDQYLTVTHLNRKLASYDFSLESATQSKAAAAASFRRSSFARALDRAASSIQNLSADKLQALQQAEAEVLKEGAELVQEMQQLQTKLTQSAVDDELKSMGLDTAYPLDPAPVEGGNETASVNATKSSSGAKKAKKKSSSTADMKKLSSVTMELQSLELDFIRDVVQCVGPVHGPSLRAALLGDVAARGSGGLLVAMQDRPLTALLSPSTNEGASVSRRVFMTRFPGDTTASQVANLREEVTAIVRSAKPGDEALVVLQTGGGTVTGYGLAAAQLLRFKEAGMKLTVAVEQVAASGGYMMCCVADKIIASPFAVLGSIGVISDMPNVYERLKKEGIEFQTVTAGKYKRTLTPTKKVTKEDLEKSKGEVEEIFVLFRDFVAQNRPQLDIESVATGETWFGKAALERKLCDEIKTVDALLMEYVDSNCDVYEVEYDPPVPSPFGSLLQSAGASTRTDDSKGFLRQGISWFVGVIAEEVKAATIESSQGLNKPLQERYRAEDDSASRVKAQD